MQHGGLCGAGCVKSGSAELAVAKRMGACDADHIAALHPDAHDKAELTIPMQ